LPIFESALIYLCGVAATWIRFGGEAAEAMITRHVWANLLTAMIVAFYLFDLYRFKAIGRRSALTLRIMPQETYDYTEIVIRDGALFFRDDDGHGADKRRGAKRRGYCRGEILFRRELLIH